MKIAIITATAIALASPAFATGPSNGPRGGNATAGASATAISGASSTAIAAQQQGQAQGQLQGQGQTQSASANNGGINVEGGVGIGVGAAQCATGLTIGVPGYGAIGGSWTNKNCQILAEAQAIAAMAGASMGLSHMTHIPRVAATVRANQGQTSAPAASTRTPVQEVAYRSCGMEDGRLVVRVAPGADQALAARQCAAAHR